MGTRKNPERAEAQREGLRTTARRLAAACRPCPEKGGDLASDCLCPCQVAVARRFLNTASEVGTDPGLLDTGPRGALRLQAWASKDRPPSCDLEAVERGLAELDELHAGCEMPGCLACEARERLEGLLAERRASVST